MNITDRLKKEIATSSDEEQSLLLIDALKEIFDLRKQIEKNELDTERLDYLQRLSKESRSGISCQFIKYPAEDGEPSSKGFRLLSFHNLRNPEKTLRESIDKAISEG
jgi:hypothetical protein